MYRRRQVKVPIDPTAGNAIIAQITRTATAQKSVNQQMPSRRSGLLTSEN